MSPSHLATRWPQKCALILLGILLSITILEIVLRLGGAAFFLAQEQNNRTKEGRSQNKPVVVLCVGESTTALGGRDAYPAQLQEVLDARSPHQKFKVINKGIPATTTLDILKKMDGFLDQYRPDIVVTMLGVNDKFYADDLDMSWRQRWDNVLGALRVYQLFALITAHLQARFEETSWGVKQETLGLKEGDTVAHDVVYNYQEEAQVWSEENVRQLLKEIDQWQNTAKALYELNEKFNAEGRTDEAQEALKKQRLIELKISYLMVGVGFWHKERGRPQEAEKYYRSACILGPGNAGAFIELGRFFRARKEYAKAAAILKRALELSPDSLLVYLELARLSSDVGQTQQAAVYYKKILDEYSAQDLVYWEMGNWFDDHNYPREAEKAYGITINALPYNLAARDRLADLYLREDQFEKAEAVYKKVIERFQTEPAGYDFAKKLALLYKERGEETLAQEYFRKSREQKLTYYFPQTAANYQAIAAKVLGRDVPLIAMQYPMREIAPLKEILGARGNLVYLENLDNFREALKEASYTQIFKDGFGGDFGHGTRRGNRLIAENLAETILKLGTEIN